MLYEVMRSINNCFDIPNAEQLGEWTIENGSIDVSFLQAGQYFIIEGSVFNDGLHQYGDTDLNDEKFTGKIRPLAIPKAFTSLVSEIEDWQEKYGDAASSPFSSETLQGEYSYQKMSSSTESAHDWTGAFKKRLRAWRKL